VITREPDFLGLEKTIRYGTYATTAATMAQGYDKFQRLVSKASGEATPLLSIALTRDFTGNILTHAEPAQAPVPAINYTNGYDGMSRLVSGEGSAESYDQLSNLVTQGQATYTYQNAQAAGSEQMRLASFNNGLGVTRSYAYDANGNPSSITNQFTSLSYDNLDHLRQVAYAQTDNYWYDELGLRVKRTENAGGTWAPTYTMYEGDDPLLVEKYTSPGRIQTTFNVMAGTTFSRPSGGSGEDRRPAHHAALRIIP
jgi:YD repeat-containing protein